MAATPTTHRARVSEIETLLSSPGSVRSAFVAVQRVRPGGEMLAALPAFAVLFGMPGDSVVLSTLGAVVIAAVFVAVILAIRTTVTIATTDAEVIVLRHQRLHPSRLDAVVGRFARGSLAYSGGGTARVALGGSRYWVAGWNADEARRAVALSA